MTTDRPHWSWNGPACRATSTAEMFRWRDVYGGHAATIRRLLRLGPFGLYVIRYRPGHVDPPMSTEEIAAAARHTKGELWETFTQWGMPPEPSVRPWDSPGPPPGAARERSRRGVPTWAVVALAVGIALIVISLTALALLPG